MIIAPVRRYVREAKRHDREVFMPLAFEPREEAQVDWHEGWIVENGTERKAQFFCMRLCYSKASFVWPYERADLESFLEGQVPSLRVHSFRGIRSSADALAMHQRARRFENSRQTRGGEIS